MKKYFLFLVFLFVAPLLRSDEIDDTQIQRGHVARLYWARVLLEDYTRWPKAYELIRFVVQNDSSLPTPAVRKLRKAANIVAQYVPEKFLRQRLNMRHLVRPFLEAQYLINEAIMDLRVPINQSQDSEIQYIEDLLKSYFFPGQEDVGIIEYPPEASYGFDLYALTPTNLALARLEASDYPFPKNKKINPIIINPAPNPPTTPGNPGKPTDPGGPGIPTIPTPPGGGVIFPKSVVNQGAIDRLSLVQRKALGEGEGAPGTFMPPENFLQNLLDLGVDLKDIATIAEKLTKELKPEDRVTNRYRPQALLLQALSDPGSVVLDPQIQDFLRGVKIKVPVMALADNDSKEFFELFAGFDGDFIKPLPKKEGDFVIDFKRLLGDQYEDGTDLGEILLEHRRSKVGESMLYVVSGVSGADLYRARTLQILLKAAQAYLPVHSKMPWSLTNLKAFVVKIPQMLAKLRESQLKYWQASSWIAQLWGTAHAVPQGFLLGARAAHRFFELNPKILQTVDKIAANPKIQWAKANTENGKLLLALTLVTVSTRITTGVMDARQSEDSFEQADILIDTASDSAANLTYLLPYVGWPSMLVDIGHDIGWLEFETSDAYNWIERGLVNTMLKIRTGQTMSSIKLAELDARWALPYSSVEYRIWKNKLSAPLADPEKIGMDLLNALQDLALRSLMHNYQAHTRYFKTRDYEFGVALEGQHKSFRHARENLKALLSEAAAIKKGNQ
jgi:hypothetical protein